MKTGGPGYANGHVTVVPNQAVDSSGKPPSRSAGTSTARRVGEAKAIRAAGWPPSVTCGGWRRRGVGAVAGETRAPSTALSRGVTESGDGRWPCVFVELDVPVR